MFRRPEILLAAPIGPLLVVSPTVGAIVVLGVALMLTFHLSPRVTYGVVGFQFGALPFASLSLRGFRIPIFLLFVSALVVLSLMGNRKPNAHVSTGAANSSGSTMLAWASVVLITASLGSFILTNGTYGTADVTEFAKWLVATALIVCLLRTGWATVKGLVVGFIIGAALAGLFAVATVMLPFGQALLASLRYVGYERSADDFNYFFLNGAAVSVRASGTFNNPNVAGLFLVVAFALSGLVLGGKFHVLFKLLLLGEIGFFLSRGAFVALATGLILFILSFRGSFRMRFQVAVATIVGTAILLTIPVTRARILTSGGSSDLGSRDRLSSMREFGATMSGHWFEGLGWGRPEFREAKDAFRVNVIPNAPLASAYRGGIIVALGFSLCVIAVAVTAFQLARARRAGVALAGFATLGFCLMIQTGYSAALLPQGASLFMLLAGSILAFQKDCAGKCVSEVNLCREGLPGRVGADEVAIGHATTLFPSVGSGFSFR